MIKILFEKSEEIRNNEMEKFMARANDENGIDTSQLYLGYLVDDKTGETEYKLLTDCSHKTPHNRFFFDIITKLAYGAKGGWTGFGMRSNDGLCVTNLEKLSEIVKKTRMTFDELEDFIDNFNKKQKDKIFNKKL